MFLLLFVSAPVATWAGPEQDDVEDQGRPEEQLEQGGDAGLTEGQQTGSPQGGVCGKERVVRDFPLTSTCFCSVGGCSQSIHRHFT